MSMQTRSVPLLSCVQHWDAHSLLSVHVGAQPAVVEPTCMMQIEFSQHESPVLPPHSSPVPEHAQ